MGKLKFALNKYNLEINDVFDCRKNKKYSGQIIITHFESMVKKWLDEGLNVESACLDFFKNKNKCIVVAREIGSGLVPVEKQDRIYREVYGNCLQNIAAKSDEVYEVAAGCGIRLKPENR